ncbi:hypothetical protein IAE37_002536 [Pseudomonas sp. S31]|uniref:hypothetical protein n=1 Tax=Pseudomonas sp. S31 TaxID=1564473 RepID=UPI0019141215|nr:hypothetical protein [Pseudomonas sp. S31]MBK5000260.1 hypothetical protein [Pseudomonas sp. S31]
MKPIFDDIIFLLSTDCFCGEILANTSDSDCLEIKKIARRTIPTIINGGNNYYIFANFSSHRIQETENNFLQAIKESSVSKQTLKTIVNLRETLKGSTDDLNTASYVINSIASRLYWLAIDDFNTPVTLELVELIAEIEHLGLDVEHPQLSWQDVWLESKSEWDLYIMSLMDGIDEAPYLTFLKLKENLFHLDFLRKWSAHLGHKKFSHIKKFIQTEAHHELDNANAAAAAKIDALINEV